MEKQSIEIRERWGNTDAYREHEQKTKSYTKEKWAEANDGMMAIFAMFASCKGGGASVVVGGDVRLNFGNKCLRFVRVSTRSTILARGKLGKDSHHAIVCFCPLLFCVTLCFFFVLAIGISVAVTIANFFSILVHINLCFPTILLFLLYLMFYLSYHESLCFRVILLLENGSLWFLRHSSK